MTARYWLKLVPALAAIAVVAAPAALAQSLSNATSWPSLATQNSIFNYQITWSWSRNVYPWAGAFVTLDDPREVEVVDGSTVRFRLPNFRGVDNQHEVWEAGGYIIDPLQNEDQSAFLPLDEQDLGRLSNQGGSPDDEGWREMTLTNENEPGAFDPGIQEIILRVGAYRVCESDYPTGQYRDEFTEDVDPLVLYARATPIVGITGVFNADDPTDLTNYYEGGTYNSYTGKIILGTELPEGAKAKLIYWVGPVRVSGAGGNFTDSDDNNVPFAVALDQGSNGPDAGATFAASGSRGLNLLNDPHAVPGLWLLTSPGNGDGSGTYKFETSSVNRDDKGLVRETTTDARINGRFSFGRLKTSDHSQEIGRPTVWDSNSGDAPKLENVVPTDPQTLELTLPEGASVTDVLGVWVDDDLFPVSWDLKTTNYWPGGSWVADEEDPTKYILTLGSALPALTTAVWIEYTYSGLSRWGGFGGWDQLFAYPEGLTQLSWSASNPHPRQTYDPLIAETYLNDLTRDYGRRTDPRQFVPFSSSSRDDGNSSNAFSFRVRYWHAKNMAPQSWIEGFDGRPQGSGVNLYLKVDQESGTRMLDMVKENPGENEYKRSTRDELGIGYIARLEPANGYEGWVTDSTKPVGGIPNRFEFNNYIAMPVGKHSYWFGTSDDILTGRRKDSRGNPLMHPNALVPISMMNYVDAMFPYWTEPVPPDRRVGKPDVFGSFVDTIRKDEFSYVDRISYQPGVEYLPGAGQPKAWTSNSYTGSAYEYPADRHPVVHALLSGIPFGQTATGHEGSGFFMGTISPYKRAFSPSYKEPTTGQSASAALGTGGSRSDGYIETAGGTTSTQFTFKVIWQSFDPETKIGRAPNYIKVFVNNTPDASGAYTGYTMSPVWPIQNPTDEQKRQYYKQGVTYERKLQSPQLQPGHHTYYFEADGGFGPVRFPVRPDGRAIEAPEGGVAMWTIDPFVSGSEDFGDKNDFCPGPYVNTAPVLSNQSVTPSSGPVGTEFVYRVTYTDGDNQRPFRTDVIIETKSGVEVRAQMYKVDPSDETYSDGVLYQYRVSSLQASAFAEGIRRYRFEFIDDWGRPDDLNNPIQGETVNLPKYTQQSPNWIDGPTVEALSIPQLLNGSVVSTDGTATSDTTWRYSVTYKQSNNTPPAFVNVYIGTRRHPADPRNTVALEPHQPSSLTTVRTSNIPVLSVEGVWDTPNPTDTSTNYFTGGFFNPTTGEITLGTALPDGYTKHVWITYASNPIGWDDGHTMAQQDPGDVTYSDGTVFFYETLLPGAQDPSQPIKYYYSFQASDGSFLSQYDATGSPSAYARTRQSSGDTTFDTGELLAGSDITYTAEFSPVVGPLSTDAGDPGVLLEPRVWTGDPQNLLEREKLARLQWTDTGVTVSPDGLTVQVDPSLTPYNTPLIASILTVKITNADGVLEDFFSKGEGGGYTEPVYDEDTGEVTTPGIITLGEALPAGYRNVIIDYSSRGDYRLDFTTGTVTFENIPDPAAPVEMEYWWAVEGPAEVGVNNPPVLSSGRFAPDNPTGVDGSTNTVFTFSVVYTEQDGPIGTAPGYVRVAIDGVEYNMTRVVVEDETGPNYTDGERYEYATTLGEGAHTYYFTASDGANVAFIGSAGNPLPGPVVSNDPVLSAAEFTMDPTMKNQVEFNVTYSDLNNLPPSHIYLLLGEATAAQKQVTPSTLSRVVVSPDDPGTVGEASPKILNVVGVWTNGEGQGTNYFTGGSFNPRTGEIQLGIPLPSGTSSVWVTFHQTPVVWSPESNYRGRIALTKSDPTDSNFRDGVVYTTTDPIMLPIPSTANIASTPPKLFYYAFVASNGLTRAQYNPNAARPADGAFGVDNEAATPLEETNPQTFVLGHGGFPRTAAPVKVPFGPIVVGPLDAGASGVPQLVLDPIVRLIDTEPDPDVSQQLTKGDGTFKNQYQIDYANGLVILGAPALETDEVTASYTFALPLDQVPYNNPPTLTPAETSGGSPVLVSPGTGSTSSTFTYKIRYRDAEGQSPTDPPGVEVVIDGVAYPMVAQVTGGNPNYINGVTYAFQKSGLAGGTHNYHFRARNDSGYAIYDGGPVPSRSGPGQLALTVSITGPTVTTNTPPALANANFSTHDNLALPSSNWTFQVTYSDLENDAPGFIYLLLGQTTAHAVEPYASDGTTSVVVTPSDPLTPGEAAPKLLNVVGVWTTSNPTASDINYYSGAGATFDPATGRVTLGRALPSHGTVYVTYHSTPISWAPEGPSTGRIEMTKLEPADITFTDGVIYTSDSGTTSKPIYIQFEGPASANIATDPPKLHYYAFEASDGISRARYSTSGPRPSGSAGGVENETPTALASLQSWQLAYGGYPQASRPAPVSPVVVGPLAAGASSTLLVLPDPVIALIDTVPDPDTSQTLVKGDGSFKTQYEIDYALGRINLGQPAAATDSLRATYWYAQSLPVTTFNNPPTLETGRVTPEVGSSATTYIYSVVYKDTDGLNGTAPSYVRVNIDGVAHEMTKVPIGTPIYRNGVEFRFQTTLVPIEAHRYYFEASDGYGYAVFDGANPQSRSSLQPISPVTPINGPVLNDGPELKNGSISPNPVAGIRRNEPVTYSVWFRDTDNDAPATGYPMTWIGSVDWQFSGGILSTVYPKVWLATDTGHTWTPSQFKDQPITWTTGKRVGITDTIVDNTNDTLIILRSDLGSPDPNKLPEVSDKFTILESSGTVTSLDRTAGALVDNTKSLAVNALAGGRIQMVTGTALGRVYTVAANSARTLAISGRTLPSASSDPTLDTDGVLSGDTYSIGDLLVGQMTLNLNDDGLVSMRMSENPGWRTDQFAGLVLQMLDGAAAWKNYTILSNTDRTIYLAQSSGQISGDMVATGDTIRVAGLSMAKRNPAANDFTVFTGVEYIVTVPGLGLGQHNARWRASNSPIVRSVRTTYQAIHPSVADYSGPLVVATVPPGNTAPILDAGKPNVCGVGAAPALVTPSIGSQSSVYNFAIGYRDLDGDPPGPHDGVSGYVQLIVDAEFNGQIIRRTYRSSVDPCAGGVWPRPTEGDLAWRNITSGVYSGFSLDAAALQLPPGTHRFHFEASDGWQITRYPANAADDPAIIVNSKPLLRLPQDGSVTPASGNAGTTFRFRVIYVDGDNQAPQEAKVVISKGGVEQTFDLVQEDPSDANYADGAVFYFDSTLEAGTYSYWFTARDSVESAAPTELQSGPVVRGDNQAPELLSGAVSPSVSAFADNSFRYSVRYRDADGDIPSFVRATVIGTDGTTVLAALNMTRSDPSDTTISDANGIEYEYEGYEFSASGTYHYLFTASDGLALATGESDVRTGPSVNWVPVLSGGSVDPTSGLSSGQFTFTVVYRDADGIAPAAGGYVRVAVTSSGNQTTRYTMTPQGTSWTTGVTYTVATQLPAGVYSYKFEAFDGLDQAVDTATVTGLTVIAAPELRSASVTPAVGRSSDTFTYRVTLANPDGTGPSEIKVFIDGSDEANGHTMTKVNPTDTNYVAGVQYQYQTTLEAGQHNWFVRARVGGITLYGAGQSPTSPTAGPIVNNPPVLTSASVTPTFGRPNDTLFNFTVVYGDEDGTAPGTGGYVRVRVSGVADPINLVPVAGQTDYANGVTYQCPVLTGRTAPGVTLGGGMHTFYFEASDGVETVRLPAGTGAFDGPRVSTPPTLTGSVTPGSGSSGTTFRYDAVYTDAENDAPTAGSVKVLIDGQPFTMTKVGTSTNYTAGVSYTYSTKLSAGSHNYLFQGSDGVDLGSSVVYNGPLVDVTGLTINASPNPAQLGSVVTISGTLSPARATDIRVTMVRPNSTQQSLTATSNASGQYSATFVADDVGAWSITAAVVDNPATAATLTPALTVSPATLRVQGGVADMISFPLSSTRGDPADIVGRQAALGLNIVVWSPATATYKFYGSSTDFPPLAPTSGFWIKPTSTVTLSLTGTLPSQTTEQSVALYAGWNQVGSGFVLPVSWPAVKVRYNGQTVSLAQAATNGWIRDYAWGYDPVANQYFLVRESGASSSQLNAYRGYWVRAMVNCTLLIQPPVSQ